VLMTTQEVIDGSLTETVGKYRGVDVKFRDVWADNLEQEFSVIRRIRRRSSTSTGPSVCLRYGKVRVEVGEVREGEAGAGQGRGGGRRRNVVAGAAARHGPGQGPGPG
jgi:hypothetical protein